jgi:hypothetical protein
VSLQERNAESSVDGDHRLAVGHRVNDVERDAEFAQVETVAMREMGGETPALLGCLEVLRGPGP